MKKQTPIATADAPLQPQLQLRSIYLRDSNTLMAQTFDPLQPNQQLHIVSKFAPSGCLDPGAPHRFAVDYTVLYFLADGATLPPAIEAMDETLAVARIAAQYAVDYVLAPGAPPPAPEWLKEFGSGNPVLHTWPYWREYCHATMLRMSLPVMMVPLLTLTHAAPNAAQDEAMPAPETPARKKPVPKNPKTH